ncbi:outer membrane beta-barrel protein [Spirosoma koreense]
MRYLFLSVLVLVPFVLSAQNSKPFKVNVAAGYGVTGDYSNSDAISKGGFAYSLEPQYRIIKNVDLGLRLEQAFVQRPEFIDKVIVFQTNAKFFMSGVITANYIVNTSGILKPYAGLGVGLYYTDPSTQRDSRFGITTSYPLPTTTVLGGLVRVGVKMGRGNLDLAYNLVSNTQVHIVATNRTLEARNSYITAKVGFTIGGGSDK